MAAGIDISLNTLAKSGTAASLFGGSAVQDSARSAMETQSMQKFQDLIESIKGTKNSAPIEVFTTENAKIEIDKSSELYEKAQELETFFVKIMLSSMRNTITKTNLTDGNNHAQKMYEDMLYDELAGVMTKSAGFGLADQAYLQLVNVSA